MVDLSISSKPVSIDDTLEDGDSNGSQQDAGNSDHSLKLGIPPLIDHHPRYRNEESPLEDLSNSSNLMSEGTIDSNRLRRQSSSGESQQHNHQQSEPPISSSHCSSIVSVTTTEDARDEEDETFCSSRWPADDPYVYSDDSASLSDAYFYPQSDDDIGRPQRFRNIETDSLIGGDGHSLAYPDHHNHQPPPVPSYYGSVSSMYNPHHFANASHQHHHLYNANLNTGPIDQRASSPLWITAGTIREDSEEIITMQPNRSFQDTVFDPSMNSLLATGSKVTGFLRHERHKARQTKRNWARQQQVLQQIKREKQTNRERTVHKVRGRPQSGHAKDTIWAYIFLIQVFFVCYFAFYFSDGIMNEESDMGWTQYLPNPSGAKNFHHWVGERFSRSNLDATNGLSGSNGNQDQDLLSKTSDLQYNENIFYNNTSKSYAVVRNSPLSTKVVASSIHAEVAGNDVNDSVGPEVFNIDYQNVVALLSVTGFYACVLAYITFVLMLILSRVMIQIMLIFSVVLASCWGMIGLSLDPYGAISVLGFTALLLTFGYAMYHWQRIPFAATNLNTALGALRCTADVAFLGLLGLTVSFSWSMIWCIASMGIMNALNKEEGSSDAEYHARNALAHTVIVLLLLWSYHWTNTVIKNILRVTVASFVGTWWFYPDDIGYCCTVAVFRPLLRASTKSLGSICLGSLLVQPAQILSSVARGCKYVIMGCSESSCMHGRAGSEAEGNGQPYENDDAMIPSNANAADEDDEEVVMQSGFCKRVCCLYDQIHSVLISINRWSFTYIGMYGYGLADAGSLAIKLFETREWLEVVKDGLIQNVLVMASVVIGGTTGTFAVFVEESGGYDFSSFHKAVVTSFIIGSVLGYVLSNILLLGIVGSAVNTVLVCFAAGPFEFDRNHPKLSREMREVWSQQVWEAVA